MDLNCNLYNAKKYIYICIILNIKCKDTQICVQVRMNIYSVTIFEVICYHYSSGNPRIGHSTGGPRTVEYRLSTLFNKIVECLCIYLQLFI